MIEQLSSIWGKGKRWLFYDIARVNKQPWLKRPKPAKLINFEISRELEVISHSRKDYEFIDLLGDIGGI